MWDLADQRRHWRLWQRHRHRSPHTSVEAGGSDSWGSYAEAGHDESTIYFRASGGKKRPHWHADTAVPSTGRVASSGSSFKLCLEPLSHVSAVSPSQEKMKETCKALLSFYLMYCYFLNIWFTYICVCVKLSVFLAKRFACSLLLVLALKVWATTLSCLFLSQYLCVCWHVFMPFVWGHMRMAEEGVVLPELEFHVVMGHCIIACGCLRHLHASPAIVSHL